MPNEGMSLNKDSTFFKWDPSVTSIVTMNLEYDTQNKTAGRMLKNNHCKTIIHKMNHISFIHFVD